MDVTRYSTDNINNIQLVFILISNFGCLQIGKNNRKLSFNRLSQNPHTNQTHKLKVDEKIPNIIRHEFNGLKIHLSFPLYSNTLNSDVKCAALDHLPTCVKMLIVQQLKID